MADMLRAVADIRAECGQSSIAAHLNAAADTIDDLYGALARAVDLIDTAYGESTANEFRSALAEAAQ